MKILFVILISVVSSFAVASGYKCEGINYNAKLFNEVQPSAGTKNPAILVVSSPALGTVFTLEGAEISKDTTVDTIIYSGQGHLKANGEFAYAELVIQKTANDEGVHYATLTMNAGNTSRESVIWCTDYLKGQN